MVSTRSPLSYSGASGNPQTRALIKPLLVRESKGEMREKEREAVEAQTLVISPVSENPHNL